MSNANILSELLAFWQAQAGKLGEQTLQHIGLTAASLLLSVLGRTDNYLCHDGLNG